ncbi:MULTISPECIES: accessory factor UbiK family protein [Paenochrobactrum]|uniref:BMFP domain-containing protein YqiC n=2 Tax=Paenochrobactrum TaxID=999488 RepID=A0A841LTU5_9HYPH|nr:accessory factor UbiK family protein [Paenochrobactrum gallinarii]MBB6259917.1 BMFP domain-containing protein YqiC [Paenochrobactrum gallinarii]
MTSGSNRILDELAKLVTDAAGAAQGVRGEVETALRSQGERVLNALDVVQREEFEIVRDLAIKARAENAALLQKIEALEARLTKLESDS